MSGARDGAKKLGQKDPASDIDSDIKRTLPKGVDEKVHMDSSERSSFLMDTTYEMVRLTVPSCRD
jgi:hypothetical protein